MASGVPMSWGFLPLSFELVFEKVLCLFFKPRETFSDETGSYHYPVLWKTVFILRRKVLNEI